MSDTAKTIIITGAGSGVGKSTAQAFLAAGWKVGLVGRRQGALEEVANGHDNALILPCDVTDEDQVEAAFASAFDTWGHLDALFNNAGVTVAGSPIDELDVAEWRKLIDINLTGAFIAARPRLASCASKTRKAAGLSTMARFPPRFRAGGRPHIRRQSMGLRG